MSTGWKLNVEHANEALELLKKARLVLLPTHQNVDADSMSSVLALRLALQQHNIECAVLVTDGALPKMLEFLPGHEDAILYGKDPLPDYDLILMADCSDRTRTAGFYRDDPSRVDGRVPIINIDHHITNDNFGVVNIVEPTAASCTEVITDILAVWGVVLTRDMAQCLLAGIYGDTLGLRTESTTARTMRTAADLVDSGGNPVPIVNALFRLKPKTSVCLWRTALRNVKWTGDLVWTELSDAEFEECGAQRSEAEGMVNFLVGTEGSRAAAILYASPGSYRVSMRSMTEDVDVAAICMQFGGGGHPRAAGVQIIGGEPEKQAFLTAVADAIAAPDHADTVPQYVSDVVLD